MKRLSIILGIILLGAIAFYNSLYFEKLDAKKQKEMVKKFSPKELVGYFWKYKLEDILKTALDLKTFDSLLVANPKILKEKYGKSVGITSSYSCLVHGLTKFSKPDKDIIVVDLRGNASYNLLMKYIFSNTARDATGYFKVNDFNSSVDFNAISSEINALIQKNVITNKLDSLNTKASIKFIGAVEVNSEVIAKEFNIVPLKIVIIQ